MGAPAVPSTPTPVAPALSVNQQQRADNIASRQANPIAPVANPAPVAPVAPAPIVQAPVDPTTGLSKPLEATTGQITQNVAPTDPIAQKPVTPKAPSKVEPIVNRQKEIETNLATGYNANPSLFNDRTAFDQAYNYQTKNPEEKATY